MSVYKYYDKIYDNDTSDWGRTKKEDEKFCDKIKKEAMKKEFPKTYEMTSPVYDEKYIWNEDRILDELKAYIDSTYKQHYAGKNKIQTTQYIVSSLGTEGGIKAFQFNIMKYCDRLGKKDGYNKKDVMKILHYSVMLMSLLERLEENNTKGE